MRAQREKSEGHKVQTMEWKVCEDEGQWQQARNTPLENSLASACSGWSKYVSCVRYASCLRWGVTCLFVLFCLGGYLWSQAQQGLKKIEMDRQAAMDAEPWLEKSVHQRESRYFIFHYYREDAVVVQQSVDDFDALYASLYSIFFAESPSGEKLTVQIDPSLAPGELVTYDRSPETLVLASPAAIGAAEKMQSTEVLAQSLMLALVDQLTEQATERYQLPPRWQPLRDGLRLWLIWKQGLGLAKWREPVVKWIFSGLEIGPETIQGANSAQKEQSILGFANELCAAHALWMQAPSEIGVPIECQHSATGRHEFIALRYPYQLPTKLPLPLVVDVPLGRDNDTVLGLSISTQNSAAPVAIATVIEYASERFGSDRLPALLAAFAHHQSWETLVPEVFGVSLTEFANGWRAFIAERY